MGLIAGWDGSDCSERATRIELALSAWEAEVLPLNYARVVRRQLYPGRLPLEFRRLRGGPRRCGSACGARDLWGRSSRSPMARRWRTTDARARRTRRAGCRPDIARPRTSAVPGPATA